MEVSVLLRETGCWAGVNETKNENRLKYNQYMCYLYYILYEPPQRPSTEEEEHCCKKRYDLLSVHVVIKVNSPVNDANRMKQYIINEKHINHKYITCSYPSDP